MTDFEGIVPALGQALTKRGYNELTPVQRAVLAPELAGADALVSAQTGSGKTVAFGLAIAPTLLGETERFKPAEAPLALAVAPTRELALQVKRELEWLYGETGAIIASCVGGMDMRTERRTLARGAHIVVGTPGRLRDHITRNSLDTSQMRAVVLDEADEMLDLGFRDDLEFILETTPEDRRTLMFSATVPRTIANLAKKYQNDAVRVSTSEEKKQHIDIEYRAMGVAHNEKENAIINILRFYEAKNALVFCNTRANVNHMTSRLNNRGFSVVALSGELSQNERTHALQAMRDGRARVCVATDVAARGIDLPNLDLVVHADLPSNAETLLHRSGRTGRAGRKGVSALIVPKNARKKAERLLGWAKLTATWAHPPSVEDVTRRDDERLLADPTLSEPVKEEEQAFAQELLSSHSAEQIAAAYVRLYRAGQSAPEELQEVSIADAPRKPRDEFGKSVWVSLSVGYKQNAEPRWLIPVMCESGNITNKQIGAIKIKDNETFVQLDAAHADKFLQAIGPGQTMDEKDRNVKVTRLDSAPDLTSEPRGRSKPDRGSGDRKRPSGGRDRKPRDGAKSDGGPSRGDRSNRAKPQGTKPDRMKSEWIKPDRPKRSEDRNQRKGTDTDRKSNYSSKSERTRFGKSDRAKPVEKDRKTGRKFSQKSDFSPLESGPVVRSEFESKSERSSSRGEKSSFSKRGKSVPRGERSVAGAASEERIGGKPRYGKNKKAGKAVVGKTKYFRGDAPKRGSKADGSAPIKRRKPKPDA
ncbi:MAG: DEAD/DEAH box helicase [Hyphomicrobiales bacterium]